MFTRGARGDLELLRTLDARSPPASGRVVLTPVRSLLRCARTLARVSPFVLRSTQNPSISLRLNNRWVCRGEPQKKWKGNGRFCLPPPVSTLMAAPVQPTQEDLELSETAIRKDLLEWLVADTLYHNIKFQLYTAPNSTNVRQKVAWYNYISIKVAIYNVIW